MKCLLNTFKITIAGKTTIGSLSKVWQKHKKRLPCDSPNILQCQLHSLRHQGDRSVAPTGGIIGWDGKNKLPYRAARFTARCRKPVIFLAGQAVTDQPMAMIINQTTASPACPRPRPWVTMGPNMTAKTNPARMRQVSGDKSR